MKVLPFLGGSRPVTEKLLFRDIAEDIKSEKDQKI